MGCAWTKRASYVADGWPGARRHPRDGARQPSNIRDTPPILALSTLGERAPERGEARILPALGPRAREGARGEEEPLEEVDDVGQVEMLVVVGVRGLVADV